MRLIHYTIGLLSLTTILVGQTSTAQAQQRTIANQKAVSHCLHSVVSAPHSPDKAKGYMAEAIGNLFPIPHSDLVQESEIAVNSSSSEPKIDGIPLSCHWRVAQKIKDSGEKFFQLLAIASKYNEAGQKDKAREILSQSLTLAKTLDYPPARAATLAMVYGQYAKAGEQNLAEKGLAESLQVANTLEDIYKALAFLEIAREYAKAGQIDSATQFLNRGSEIAKIATDEPIEQIQILAELGDEYIKIGQKDKAALVLTQGIEIAKTAKVRFHQFRQSTLGFTKLASISIAIGREDITNQIVQIARSQDTTNSSRILIAIASEYAKAKQPEKANQLLSESLNLAKTIELGGSSIGSVPLKIVTLLDIATKYVDMGEQSSATSILSLALQIAQSLPDDNQPKGFSDSKTIALAEIASKYGLVGQKDKANALLTQALQMANQFSQSSTEENSYEPNYRLSRIANAYAQLGEYDEALQVANTIKDIDIKAETFGEIAGNYPVSQKDEAAILLAQALQIAQTSKDRQGNTLFEIALAYLKIGEKDKAGELLTPAFQLIKGQELSWGKFAKLTEIAEKFGETGQKEKAAEVAVTALPETNELMNYCAKNEALMMVSQMYVSAGEYENALQIARTINTCEYRSKALANIAIAYAKDGQYPQSLEVTESIQSDTKVLVLSAVAVNYAEAGDYQTGMQIARSLQDNTSKIRVLVEIAGKYITEGKQAEATPILQESIEIINSFEDNYFKALYLTEIAGNYAKAGQQSTTIKLLGQAKELSKTLVNSTEKDNVFAKIAISRRDDIWGAIAIQSLKMGQLEVAVSSINTLEDAEAKVKVLVEIAAFYIESGEKDKADEVLVRAKQIAQTIEFNKSEALEAIAIKYATLEQYDQAQKVVNSIENPQRRDRWTALLECVNKN